VPRRFALELRERRVAVQDREKARIDEPLGGRAAKVRRGGRVVAPMTGAHRGERQRHRIEPRDGVRLLVQLRRFTVLARELRVVRVADERREVLAARGAGGADEQREHHHHAAGRFHSVNVSLDWDSRTSSYQTASAPNNGAYTYACVS